MCTSTPIKGSLTCSQVEELSQGLDSRIAESEQQGYGGVADVKQTADALFHSDDKLLSSLQKLGWELETEDPEEQDNVVTLRETCARSACPFPPVPRRPKTRD